MAIDKEFLNCSQTFIALKKITINMSVHLLKSNFAFPLLFVVNKA